MRAYIFAGGGVLILEGHFVLVSAHQESKIYYHISVVWAKTVFIYAKITFILL